MTNENQSTLLENEMEILELDIEYWENRVYQYKERLKIITNILSDLYNI
jgi:hypothetical protein